MKEMARYGLILALICAVASASLAIVNAITKPKILAQAASEETDSLKSVMPDADNFEPVKSGEDILYYKAYKAQKIIGAAFKAAGKGYSSEVQAMVGMAKDGKITAIKILTQNETPGLGAQVAEPFFTDRFTQKNIGDLSNIQAITGATISSKAVIDSVKKKAQEIEALIKDAR